MATHHHYPDAHDQPYTLTGTQGPTLVLIHGYPLDARLWQEQAELATCCRLLNFDLPGFGQAQALPLPECLEDYAAHVESILDQAHANRVVLVGLSMGGYIALACWRLFRARITGLILCDTRAEADAPAARSARDQAIAAVSAGFRQQVIDPLLERVLATESRRNPQLVAKVQAMMQRASAAGIIAALRCMRDRADASDLLAQIDVPTLIVVGQEDGLTPPDLAQALAHRIPQAELCIIPKAGHLSPLEQPTLVNAALRHWLDSHREKLI